MAPKKKSSENIRVVVRCRHLLPFEAERGDKLGVTVDLGTNQVLVKHAIGEPDVKAFDAVFDNSFTQRQIFVQEVKPLVDSVLQGYNATVFAYGQSGSGKTFTMTGDLESKDPAKYGMMPQVVEHLFSEIARLTSATKQYKVRVTYVELYNGKSRDLLSDRQVPLDIKENLAKNFYVKGAENPEVMNWAQCMGQFDHGTNRRRTASTDLNEHSSRSHSLFTLMVEQHDFEQDPQAPVIISSKINVVDLAGSERLGKTNATGETMVEGCNINLSLSQLATVIDTIVKGAKHIPYRSGPLTMLLKDSLGGNSKTVMFANVSPSDKNTAETISTLRFAERAKQIENKPIKNLDPKDARIQELLDKIEELQKRLGGAGDLDGEEKLRERISELEAENDKLREDGGVDTIAMEEASRQLQLQVQQATEKLKARDAELVALQQAKDLMQSNLKTDLASANELRSISAGFLKRLMTPQQLQMISQSMPHSIEQSADGVWDVAEISCYMDGYVQLHEAWRKTALTQDDVAREVARVRAEVERQLGAQVQLLENEKNALLKQREDERRSQSANTEAQSQVRVEADNVKEENKKLREKVERDQEKFKKKLDKVKEEQTAVQVELDALKTEMSSKTREVDRLKKQLEDANSLAATASEMVRGASPTRADQVGGDAGRQVLELQQELERVQQAKDAVESRNRVLNLQLRRGAVWQLPDGAVAPPPPPPDGEDADMQNDAFVIPTDIDGDLIGVLQQQVRIQHRLQELHHTHQKKLDVMLKKFELVRTGTVTSIDKAAAVVAAVAANNAGAAAGGAAAGAAAGGGHGGHGGVPDAVVQERVLEAVRAKQEELDTLRVETDKTMDKLVRKMNKRVSEFEQREKELKDEIAAMMEERDEAAAHADDLTRFNGQLALEVENLRSKFETRGREAAEDATLRDSETAHLKLVVAQLEHGLEAARSKGDQYDQLQDEYQRLQAALHRMENTMQEKLADLENSRQMIKWNNSLLAAEKKRTEEAEIRLRDQDLSFRDVEEAWRQKLVEHGQKLVAANGIRMEEQAAQYQHLLEEEAGRTKEVKDKLKSAKQKTAKAAQRYDEMVFENEVLQNQFEELKFNSMKSLRDQNRASVTNESDMIRNMIRGQQRDYDAMGGGGGQRRGW